MKRHPFAVENLIFGIFFLAITTTWVIRHQSAIEIDHLGIVVPIALIAVGTVGIIATIWRKK